MSLIAEQISEQILAVRHFHRRADEVLERLLASARKAEVADQAAATALCDAAKEIGRNAQARQGQLVQILAQADRIKTPRGGLGPWIARNLDSTEGAARGIARSVRELGHLPELSEPLSSGRVGAATIRAMTRRACAAKGADADVGKAVTATLKTAAEEGVGEALRQVRILERAVKPMRADDLLADQRLRSYLRAFAADGGMCRVEVLLDPESAEKLRAVLEQIVAAWLEARQSEPEESVPEHLRTVEQLRVRALMHIAEAFGRADSAEPAADAQRTENPYGLLLPRPGLTLPPHAGGSIRTGTAFARHDGSCARPDCDLPQASPFNTCPRIRGNRGGESAIRAALNAGP